MPTEIMDVVFPAMTRQTVLALISSQSPDPTSTASKIIDAKYDDGSPVFKKFTWTLACEPCIRNKIADKCTHKMFQVQHWHSKRGIQRTRAIMEYNSENVRREIL